LPWQQESSGENANHAIERHGPENRGYVKQLAIIFHGDRVIVNFVPKFVAMTIGVDSGKI